ncbi:family 47 glycosyl hydrolase [Coniochaeta sp. 2T2.1]|nr:family 47 glycosyl hydrolase [Coniochaeta sp. 2T2.1]
MPDKTGVPIAANLEEPKKPTPAWRRRVLAIATNPLFILFWAAIVALIVVLLVQRDTTPELHFRPSTVDWANWTQYYPVTDSIRALPTGTPRDIPKIQFEFPLYRPDAVSRQRQQAVKDVFVRGWDSYKENAWEYDELLPVSGGWQNSLGGWGLTMIDALDTLYIMGLRDEFDFAAGTIAQLDWANTTYHEINVFETTIRHLGGLLSAYDLSREKALLQKAEELGNMLYLAFDTPNRLPPFLLDFVDAKSGTQIAGDMDPGAGPGSLSLEFTRLAQLTGDNKFFDAVDRITSFLERSQNASDIPGLWPVLIDFRNEDVTQDHSFTLGANSDSLYEYFPKMHLLLGGLDPKYESLYRTAMDAAIPHLLFKPMLPGEHDHLFTCDAVNSTGYVRKDPTSQHLGCFAGGMFALGGKIFSNATHVTIGDRLARSCAWAYSQFESGIMPEKFGMIPCANLSGPCWFDDKLWDRQRGDVSSLPVGFTNAQDPRYLLRPEAIESVFLLYRMTGASALLDVAWGMFESIVNATETGWANSAVGNVTTRGGGENLDAMDSFWLSETLKYFYLIFSPPFLLSLDDFVFNTEAHPFRRPK